MRCFRHFGSDREWNAASHSFFGAKRMVRKRKGTAGLTVDEMYEYDALKRVEADREKEAEHYGEKFRPEDNQYLASNPDLAARVLGVRRDLAHTIPHLVETGTNEALERMVSSDPEFKAGLNAGAKRFVPGREFFGTIAQIFKPKKYKSPAQKRVESIYGDAETIEGKRIHLAENIWRSLNDAGQNAVGVELDRLNIARLHQPRGARLLPLRIAQLANATAGQLIEIRVQAKNGVNLVFPQPLQTAPPEEYANPPSELDRLIQLRKVETQQIDQIFSTSKYDPARLQQFLDMLAVPIPHGPLRPHLLNPHVARHECSQILKSILEDHSLIKIKNNPPVQALLADLEVTFHTRGPIELRNRLKEIQKNLPKVKIDLSSEQEEGEESDEEKEKAEQKKTLGQEVLESHGKLEEFYVEAETLGRDLHKLNQDFRSTVDAFQNAGGGGNRGVDTGLARLRADIAELSKEKRELMKKINKLENSHLRSTKAMIGVLESSGDDVDFLKTDLPKAASTEKEIFGNVEEVTNDYTSGQAAFKGYIRGLELDKLQLSASARTQRLNPLQLLFRLKVEEAKQQGISNEQLAMETAQQRALAAISQAQSIPLDRARTRELSEKIGATPWQALKKYLTARFTEGTVYTMEDILGGITQKGSGLERFAPLSPYMTDDELHVWLDENPEMETEELVTYVEKIKACLRGFRYDGGSVELMDRDATPLAHFARRLENIIAVRRVHAAAFADQLEPGEAALSQATMFSREMGEVGKEEKKTILGKLTDKVKSIGRWINRNILGREKKDIVEEIKSKKMSKEEAKSLLESKGLAGVAGIAAAATTAVDIAEKGSYLRRGLRGAARAPRAVGRTGRKVMRGGWGFAKFVTTPVWWPLKQGWRGAKWTGGKIGKGAKWAGGKLAKFWRWI